jgi:DNA-binding transcriptional MerR regulator
VKIGELAKKAGTNPSTVRYYEDAGLMPLPERTDSGYREYDESDLSRITLILQARNLGFNIQETRVIVSATESDDPCPEVAEIVERRISQIDNRIADMQGQKRELTSRIAAWKSGRLSNPECICAILEQRQETNMSTKHNIEIFTAGCKNCDESVRIVKEAVGACGCSVTVLPADGEEAKKRGVNCAPCVWRDGERVFCGTPTLEEAIATLRVIA